MPKPSKSSKAPKFAASAARPGVPAEAAKAFSEVEPILEALPADTLAAIKTDIPTAVSVAIGAVPHLAGLRDSAAKLPDFDIANIDRLGTYALAAWYAHLLALPEVPESALATLLEQGKPLREDMLLSAELLARKGLFYKKAVQDIRAGQGNLDTANDLVALAALFTAAWPEVQNKTPVTQDDIQCAAELGPRLLVALGARRQLGVKEPNPSDPQERRRRAYTLFVRAYDQCRRAVTYLRWGQDVDSIAPSLFAHRTSRKPAGEAEAQEPAEAEAEATAEASDK